MSWADEVVLEVKGVVGYKQRVSVLSQHFFGLAAPLSEPLIGRQRVLVADVCHLHAQVASAIRVFRTWLRRTRLEIAPEDILFGFFDPLLNRLQSFLFRFLELTILVALGHKLAFVDIFLQSLAQIWVLDLVWLVDPSMLRIVHAREIALVVVTLHPLNERSGAVLLDVLERVEDVVELLGGLVVILSLSLHIMDQLVHAWLFLVELPELKNPFVALAQVLLSVVLGGFPGIVGLQRVAQEVEPFQHHDVGRRLLGHGVNVAQNAVIQDFLGAAFPHA